MSKTEIPPIAIDLDGGTDIGAAIVDADLFLIDDGAGGTMRKTAASRLKTYVGGGKILQAVTNSHSTEQSTTSTSYQNSDADVTITPASTSNKVLILGQINCGSYKNSGTASTAASVSVGLFRGDKDGTQLTYGDVTFTYTPSSSGTTYSLSGIYPFAYLDSPSTSSSQTYTVCYKSINSGFTAYMQWGAVQSGTYSSIMTALEIEG
tara:strand:+ start:203 stop:823 length:621 start_codon:yes stop_codon:yes gene_type:complete